MCQMASFKHNPERQEIAVYNLVSHGATEEQTGKTEASGWYDGHYLPDGTVQCRVPGGEDAVMDGWVKSQWPTFGAFLKWALCNGADVNAKDGDGNTAMVWAAYRGHDKVFTLLIKAGADVNSKDSYGNTALLWAASKGNDKAVELLKQHGAK